MDTRTQAASFSPGAWYVRATAGTAEKNRSSHKKVSRSRKGAAASAQAFGVGLAPWPPACSCRHRPARRMARQGYGRRITTAWTNTSQGLEAIHAATRTRSVRFHL